QRPPVFMKRLDIQLQSLRRIAQGLVDIIACRGTARKVREPDANGPVRPCILNDGDIVSHSDLSQASSLRPYKWHGQVPFPSPSWGDVPGLDRSQSKPLGWLRQAGASILKLTVVVWIVFCDLHEPTHGAVINPHEAGGSHYAIVVWVIVDPQQSPFRNPRFDCINLRFREHPVGESRHSSFLSWGHGFGAWIGLRNRIKWLTLDIDVEPDFSDCCFSITDVCRLNNQSGLSIRKKFFDWENAINSYSWAVTGDKFFTRQSDLIVASSTERNCCDPKADRRKRQYQIEQCDRVASNLLPKGFTFVLLIPVFLGGLVTLFYLSFGRGIRCLPSENGNPKKGA